MAILCLEMLQDAQPDPDFLPQMPRDPCQEQRVAVILGQEELLGGWADAGLRAGEQESNLHSGKSRG